MNLINTKNITYALIAVAVASVMFYVVLPNFPQVQSTLNLNTQASDANAFGGDGGGSGGGGGGGEGGGCCGGGGDNGGPSGDNGGGSNDSPSPYIPPAPAVCNYLTASPTTLPYGGGTVTLSWNTSDASSVYISSVGSVGASGTYPISISVNTTFTLTATGAGGNASCTASVTVSPPPTPAAVCSYFDVSPNTLPYGGGNVTITWQTTDATSVSIDNGVGAVSANGSKTVFVSSDTTFRLTAIGAGGNDTHCVDSVTVGPPPTPVATCDSFTADRYNVPYNGGNVLLTWATTNATSVSIDNGIGNVSVDGSKNVYVDSTTTYTLTAVGAGGNDTCTVTITKGSQPQAPICNYLRVSDDEVEEGDDVTLSWETTNATSVSIDNGIGNVSADGSKTVEIDDDTTFTLTAVGTNGSDTCTVRVEIEEEEDKKTPKCELDISKDRVKRGEKVTLSWETTNVDEIVIKDDRGNTIFDTDDYSSSKRKKYFDGEIDVIINQSTEFRMKAEGEDGGSRTCKVDVEVDDIAVYEKRDQALVIALTQVPYTGFEAGAFLTFLFYAVLTLWALFIAYILVVKKGSVLGFSLYGAGTGMSETDVENRKKVEALVAKYADQSWK